MKNKFLKLDNPCSEKWENMKPKDQGKYCDLCSKNVMDFTNLSQVEISEIINKSGNKICARVTHTQLNLPLFNLDRNLEFTIPTSNVAAGLMFVSLLTTGQNLHAENQNMKTEFIQSSDSTLNSEKERSNSKPSEPKLYDLTIFKGRVTSNDLGKPVENTKITIVTSEKLFSTYTLKDGTFSIEIPTNLIDNDNVIRVSYFNVTEKRDNDLFFRYETMDYVLTKKEFTTEYLIKAEPEVIYLGGIGSYIEKREPIVLSNGIEIKYREFVKAQLGKKSSCNLENKDYLYFESKFAIAIYGNKAKEGLYILTDKTEK